MLDDLQKLLTSAANSGQTVSKSGAAGKIQELMVKIKSEDMAPQAKLATLTRLYNNVMKNPDVSDLIRVDAANKMKRYIYQELGPDFYAKFLPVSQQIERQGRRALGQGLREGVETAVPESAALNQKMGPLINARNIAEERVLAAGNRDPLGLGAFAVRHPAELGAWLLQRWPASESMIARLLYHGGEPLGMATGAAAGGTLAELQKIHQRNP